MPVERCAQHGESVGPSGPVCSQQISKLCRVASQGCQRPAATPNSFLQARSLAELLPAPALIPPLAWAVSLERFRTCWEAGRDLGKQGTAWVGVVQRVQASVFTFCLVGAVPHWHLYLGMRMSPGWLGNPRKDIYSTCKESLHVQMYPGGYEGEFDVVSVTL